MAKTVAETPKVLTEYVVLKRETVTLPADDGAPVTVEAWLVVATHAAGGKAQAIRMFTGDGADVIEGAWRAVPVSSWKGGEETRRKMDSERLPLDE